MSVYTLKDMQTFADVIRRAREFWGYSQRELSEKAGVSQKFVSELESGKETVQLKQTLKVVWALELDVSIDLSRLVQ